MQQQQQHHATAVFIQWRTTVVKIWGQAQSGQATKLVQITPYVNDFQTLNNPGS